MIIRTFIHSFSVIINTIIINSGILVYGTGIKIVRIMQCHIKFNVWNEGGISATRKFSFELATEDLYS